MSPLRRALGAFDPGLDGHGGTARLRRANLERALAFAVDHSGPFTRGDLMEATGFSAPTAGRLVADLVRGGLVRNLGAGPSHGGRRPSLMEFDARCGFAAAIAVGAGRTRLAVADLAGEPLALHAVDTPRDLHPKALLSQVAAALRRLAREAGVPRGRLLAVGAGTPGLVDLESGTVVALAPGLRGWFDVPAGRILEDALEAPVLVENDVNLAVLGEHWRGAARGHDTCAYLDVGIGIGAGVLVEGRLHRGRHSMAGEIAFMCMAPEHAGRDFGDHGCLETLAGLEAIAARWPRGARGEPGRWLADLYGAARSGEPEARALVEEMATLVGIAAANLCLVIDPSLLVVGGTVPVPDSPFVEQVQRTVAGILPSPLDVVASALREEAPLWGGLLVAITRARRELRLQLHETVAH